MTCSGSRSQLCSLYFSPNVPGNELRQRRMQFPEPVSAGVQQGFGINWIKQIRRRAEILNCVESADGSADFVTGSRPNRRICRHLVGMKIRRRKNNPVAKVFRVPPRLVRLPFTTMEVPGVTSIRVRMLFDEAKRREYDDLTTCDAPAIPQEAAAYIFGDVFYHVNKKYRIDGLIWKGCQRSAGRSEEHTSELQS